VHQAVAITFCTQQVIQGENFRDRLKNREYRESFAVYGIMCSHHDALFGHLANQKAINDQALVETACNISSFGIYYSVLQSW